MQCFWCCHKTGKYSTKGFTCKHDSWRVFAGNRFTHLLEDFAAGSDLGVTVGSKGELVRCPALTDQVIRVRNRISGKSTENISDITDDLGYKIGQLKPLVKTWEIKSEYLAAS